MKIQFERSGGFAGMRTQATFDTDDLPDETAAELHTLVADACFFDLPETTAPGPGADQFSYTITVENDARTHTVRIGDRSAPDSLQPLLRRLTRLARSQP